MIDKESYETWVKKQQEQKERQVEIKRKKAENLASKGGTGSNRNIAAGATRDAAGGKGELYKQCAKMKLSPTVRREHNSLVEFNPVFIRL